MGTGCCEQTVLSKTGQTVKRSVKTRPIIRIRYAVKPATHGPTMLARVLREPTMSADKRDF